MKIEMLTIQIKSQLAHQKEMVRWSKEQADKMDNSESRGLYVGGKMVRETFIKELEEMLETIERDENE